MSDSELIGLQAVGWDRFLTAVGDVLVRSKVRGLDLSGIVCDALAASVTPAVTAFRLEGPACGMAELIHRAAMNGNPRVYDVVRASVPWADCDRLLDEGSEATCPSLRQAYGVSMSNWSDDPSEYRMVLLADLPQPWNLREPACPSADRYHMLEQVAARKPNMVARAFGKSAVTEAEARRTAWTQFQQELADGDTPACELHILTDDQWREAVEVAFELVNTQRPWNKQNVYREFRDQRGVEEPLPPVERVAWSLLSRPITWAKVSHALDDGQHRICGATAAGLSTILVRVVD